MFDTNKWIKTLYDNKYKDNQYFSKEIGIEILKKSTILNQLMQNEYDDYISSFINDFYPNNEKISSYILKSTIMVDYPIANIESLLNNEYVEWIRKIKVGILPRDELNACVVKSPNGEDVIFISDWLFAFLWNYHNDIVKSSHNSKFSYSANQKIGRAHV